MSNNVGLTEGFIEVGGGAAAGDGDAGALPTEEVAVAPPPDELPAGDVDRPGFVPGNNAESEAHPGPAPPAGLDAVLHHLRVIVAGQDAPGTRICHIEQVQAQQ